MFKFKTLWKNKVFIVFLAVVVALAPQAAARPAQMLSKTLLTTVGINKVADGYEVSGEMIINKADQPQSAERKTVMVSATAPTIGEAVNKISASQGREVSFAHTTLIIVASGLDGEDVTKPLTYFLQKTEINNGASVVYTKDDPKALIEASIKQAIAQGGMLGQTAKYNQDNVIGKPTSLETFFKDSLRKSATTITPVVALDGEEIGNNLAIAIFHNGKFAVTLDEAQSTALNFLQPKKTKLRYNIAVDEHTVATLIIQQKKSKIKTSFRDGVPHYKIQIKTTAKVEELSSQLEIDNHLPAVDIEMELVRKLSADLVAALDAVAAEGADILNLYDIFNRRHTHALKNFMADKNPSDLVRHATHEIKVDVRVYS